MLEIVDIVVQAAEQAGLAALAKGQVLDKKQWALDHLEKLAKARNLGGIDIAAWEALIESTVATYNWGKLFNNNAPTVNAKA